MLIEERLEKIKNIIDEQKSATIELLSNTLGVSKDTIRRDLIKLEERNIVRRTHGGAISVNREAIILDYEQRSNKLHLIKKKIAQKVGDIIKDNSSVIFDSSTTVEATIQQLGNRNIYAITNSLTHAMLLAKLEKVKISILPGNLHKEQLFLYGSETVKKIEQYNTDYTLLGVFALSKDGLFIHTEEEGLVKRQMIEQGNKVIALADHTKLNTTGFFKVCDLNSIDLLITDKKPDEELMENLHKNRVEVLITDE